MKSTAIESTELLEIVESGDISRIAALIEKGANPNFRDVLDGSTCLHRIAGTAEYAALEFLLKHGADPNILTQNTAASPLGIAASAGRLENVELLLKNDARLSTRELSTGLIEEIREYGFDEIVQLLLE